MVTMVADLVYDSKTDRRDQVIAQFVDMLCERGSLKEEDNKCGEQGEGHPVVNRFHTRQFPGDPVWAGAYTGEPVIVTPFLICLSWTSEELIVTKSAFRNVMMAVAAVSLAACGGSDDAPSGQVVARVNGTEITLSELNAELLANNLSDRAEDKAVVQTVLQRLIARKLLVEKARDEGLHQNTEFIVSRQRSEENELAGLLQQQMIGAMARPTREEAEQFIRENPDMFNNRQVMILEQIRFAQPANANDVKFLEAAASLDEAAALLDQNAIRYDRGPTVFDTSSVNPQLATSINALPPGEVFVISNGQMVLVNTIREKRPAAIPPDAALQYASQLLQQRRAEQAVEAQVTQLREEAEITFQEGYGPEQEGEEQPVAAAAG